MIASVQKKSGGDSGMSENTITLQNARVVA